eukprot:scaffold12160_cov75-Skeletonema_marinoi.AAC.7
MNEDSMSKSICGSCGSAEVDEIKLKNCTACDLVKYCSIECQENHKSQHKEACKKRAAELRDELLFNQPGGSHLGDCPICFIPLPLYLPKSILKSCCSKVICNGCSHANKIREWEERIEHSCPFCRKPTAKTDEERDKNRMKRIEANDSVAINYKGVQQYEKGDYSRAFEYYTKAAGLGDAEAHYWLSHLYSDGLGVEKDKQKEVHHLELAAIGGHSDARFNLGCHEWNNDNKERAVKHYIIAATQGEDLSAKSLMDAFKIGLISKEEFAATLRANQSAVDATRSPQREAAEEYYQNKN